MDSEGLDATLDDVERLLSDTFEASRRTAVREQLARLENAPLITGDAARTKVAALIVAAGRWPDLVAAVERGLADWRDLLVSAFYAEDVQAQEQPMASLSEAVVVWTGFEDTATPARDPEGLVARFGALDAADLLPAVQALEADFVTTDAVDRVADLSAAADAAAAEFRGRHPEVSERAVAALTWCFTFDWS